MHLLALLVVVAGWVDLSAAELTASSEVLIENFPEEGCPRLEDTNAVNSCIKTNIEHFAKILKERKPGLPELDPYFAGNIEMDFIGGPFNIKIYLSNLSLSGLTDVHFHEVRSKLKPDSMEVDLNMTFARTLFNGNIKVVGRFASWDVTGHGHSDASFTNIKALWRIVGEKAPGSKYMLIKRATPTYTVGGMKFHAKGLVDKYPSVNDLIVLVINRFWPEIIEIGKPFAQKPMSEHIRMMAESVFKNVPYEKIFPKAA